MANKRRFWINEDDVIPLIAKILKSNVKTNVILAIASFKCGGSEEEIIDTLEQAIDLSAAEVKAKLWDTKFIDIPKESIN